MWPFNIFKKPNNPKKRLTIEEKRAIYQRKREYLQKESSRISDLIYDEKKNSATSMNNVIDKENSVCPHCGSKNIINVYHRPKGEINGDISGSYSLRYGTMIGRQRGVLTLLKSTSALNAVTSGNTKQKSLHMMDFRILNFV